MNKRQMRNRMKEIEEEALRCYLDKSNYSIFDWMDKETALEYERLQYAVGDSDYNPAQEVVR